MGGQGSINKTRGSAKSPWELKRGCGVAALLRRYCGARLLSGPAFWENDSRASARHMPLDICPQHVTPISKQHCEWESIATSTPTTPPSTHNNTPSTNNNALEYLLHMLEDETNMLEKNTRMCWNMHGIAAPRKRHWNMSAY